MVRPTRRYHGRCNTGLPSMALSISHVEAADKPARVRWFWPHTAVGWLVGARLPASARSCMVARRIKRPWERGNSRPKREENPAGKNVFSPAEKWTFGRILAEMWGILRRSARHTLPGCAPAKPACHSNMRCRSPWAPQESPHQKAAARCVPDAARCRGAYRPAWPQPWWTR